MGRTILAVIVGVIAMAVCVGAIEMLGHHFYPPPPGIDFNNAEAIKALMEQLPVTALMFVAIAWLLGSLVGGLVAAKISRLHKRGAALAVAIVMLLLVVINLVMIPHPLWMAALGVLLPVPMALLGRRLAGG